MGTCLLAFAALPLRAQNTNAEIVQRIDAAVRARDESVASYTVVEHYAMFRNRDEEHPAAEMTVKTVYQKDVGKNYTILSESGSTILRKAFETILDNEKRLNQPANRATALITSANYEMNSRGTENVGGRSCFAMDIKPRRDAPYLIRGTVWVATDGTIVQLQGISSKSPSILAGNSQLFRQYAMIDGVSMATHARAVSNSWMLGRTVISIDYTDYQIQLRAGQ